MKKVFKVLGVISIVVIAFIILVFFKVKNTKIPEINITEVDLTKIGDGTYTGEYSQSPVKAKVQVVVKDNKIISIEIKQHDNGLGKKAEKITEQIINNQLIKVDAVSGATQSSNVIKKAVEIALTK